MASVFDFGPTSAGAGSAAIDGYLLARQLAAQEEGRALRSALGVEQLATLRRNRANTEAMGADEMKVSGLPAMRQLGGAAPVSIVPRARTLGPDVLANLTAVGEDPSLSLPPPAAPRSAGMPSIAPAEAFAQIPAGRTTAEMTQALGPETMARMSATEQGRARLKAAGHVTEDEKARNVARAEGRLASQQKFAEAREAILSDDPEESARGLLLEGAALRELALVVDKPEAIAKRSQERVDLYVAAQKKPGETRRVGEELKRLLSAADAWTPDDVASGDRFWETAASMTTAAGQGRADEIVRARVIGIAGRFKHDPEADWDKAMAQAMEDRRKAGMPTDGLDNLAAVAKRAGEINPTAFARYLNDSLKSAAGPSRTLRRLLNIPDDTPRDIQQEAASYATHVKKLKEGSAQWYEAFSERVTTLTKDRQRAFPPRTLKNWDRAQDLDEQKVLQGQWDLLQKRITGLEGQITKRQSDNAQADVSDLQGELDTANQALNALVRDMVEQGQTPPGVGEALGKAKKPAAKAPPAKPTIEAFQAEAKRLVAAGLAAGLSLEEAKAHGKAAMQAKGWTPK